MFNHEQDRYGSARIATLPELKRAGIVGGKRGASFGFDATKRHMLRVPGDGSIALFGGAGSGKSAGPYATCLLRNLVGNAVCLDLRSELTSISLLAASLAGYEVYSVNPTGMNGLPQHRTNPLHHLRITSPTIVADCQKGAMDIIPASQGGEERPKWWENDAQDWLTQLLLFDAERAGCASLRGVYKLITILQGDLDAWCIALEGMMRSRFASVQRFAGQIMELQRVGRDGFTAPLGTLNTAFRFMQDPRIVEALSGNDFTMDEVVAGRKRMRVQIIIPIEYVQVWAPALRLLIGSAIQSKLRNIHAPALSLLIDECGQLGHFPSVREAYTFGRGARVFAMCAWQEISQIYGAFGHHGGNEIIGSAQIRVFKGVRTLDTARLVSEMAGTMTLSFDAVNEQSNARRLKQQAAQRVLAGGSFLEACADLRHYRDAAVHRTKQPRALFTPDEVLNLPPSQMIAFASGLVEGPIVGHWLMYFEQPQLAGKYLANPYHDPDRVRIPTLTGFKMARVITKRVPRRYAHLPQYASGTWSYVEGYRP